MAGRFNNAKIDVAHGFELEHFCNIHVAAYTIRWAVGMSAPASMSAPAT